MVSEEYCFGSQDWWIEKVKSLPKNAWFSPTNKDGEEYSVCIDMSTHNWISKMIEPVWSNGSFKGNKISFFIKIDDEKPNAGKQIESKK